MQALSFLLVLVFFLTAFSCDNILPESMEKQIRERMAKAEEKERMLSEAAVFSTKRGKFAVRFYGEEVPNTILHLRELIHDEFYKGVRVHRAVTAPVKFVVQFGDELTRGNPGEDFVWRDDGSGIPVAGTGEPPKLVDPEQNAHKHDKKGIVGLARRSSDDRGGSQLYITLAPQPRLDDGNLVVGEVLSGMPVVETLSVGDEITGVELVPLKQFTGEATGQ